MQHLPAEDVCVDHKLAELLLLGLRLPWNEGQNGAGYSAGFVCIGLALEAVGENPAADRVRNYSFAE